MTTTAMTPEKPQQDFSQLTIRQVLTTAAFKEQVSRALPKHMNADRMARVALTALTRTPKLADCDQASFLKCMMDLSAWGLEPNGREAHLIPFYNNKRGCMECQLIIDYKGIVELIRRTGLVSVIHADTVCDKDEFEYDRGQLITHKPNYREPRGPMYAVYALIRFKDGAEQCTVMTMDEVQAIRKRSKSANNGPWVTDFDQMALKTVFKRLSKWISLSPEIRDAMDHDENTIEGVHQPVLTGPRPDMPGNLQALTDQMASQEGDSNDGDGNDSGLEQGEYVGEGGEIQGGDQDQGGTMSDDPLVVLKASLAECRVMTRVAKTWENFQKYHPELIEAGKRLVADAEIRVQSNKQKSLPGA